MGWQSDNKALTDILHAASEVAGYLWQRGWAERNGGNLSVDVTAVLDPRDPASPRGEEIKLGRAYPDLASRYYLVTGSGYRFRDCAVDIAHNMCIIRLTGEGGGFHLVWGGEGASDFRPTSEFPSHLGIHQFLAEKGAPDKVVLHTHPTELIALTHFPEFKNEAALNDVLWRMHPEVKVVLPRGVGVVPYTCPGTEELAVATVAAFARNHPVAMWEMHGVVARSNDVRDAFDLIDTLNKSAQIWLMCHSAGLAPAGLSADNIAELIDTFHLPE